MPGEWSGKHWIISERFFYFLCGEQIGKAGMKVKAIGRQLGEVMVAWTSVMSQRPVADIEPISLCLPIQHITHCWPLK